jgi:cysteinyl-tRNA synthetase
MSWKHLGEVFDIHGGGIDLQFPHHENEIAQSTCAHGTRYMARYWMHNGFLQVEGQKMSKSLGNFITIHELLEEWPGEVLRLNMLRTHYRAPIDWTRKGLEESKRILDKWYRAIGDVASAPAPDETVIAALADDLHTPRAIAELHRLAAEGKAAELKASANLMGLLPMTESEWLEATAPKVEVDEAEIEQLIAARNAARAEKNWAEADRIRDELAAKGIVLKDGPEGTTWEVKR